MRWFSKLFKKADTGHNDNNHDEEPVYFTDNLKQLPNPDMILPVDIYSDEKVEIYFRIPREKANETAEDLLTIIRDIDALVQRYPKTEYEIGYIDIYDDKVKIRYYGLLVNTEFDVEVHKNSEQWYCSAIGMERFNPPKCISKV